MDAVSERWLGRQLELAGFDRMVGWSLLAHVTVFGLTAIGPAGWLMSPQTKTLEAAITIDVSGTVGPYNGGLTPSPARQAQPVSADVAESGRPIEPVRRPAATQRQPRPATPSPEARPGEALAETGRRVDGAGLTTGGGGGTGAQIDVGDFCCPEYIATMQELINRNWTSKQQVQGATIMTFTIERDGQITNLQRQRSSGHFTLDYLSERALLQTKQLPPLPDAFTQPALTVHLTFEYYR